MIEILIIEDNPDKLRNIYEAVIKVPGIDADKINTVFDQQNAKKILKTKKIDIVLLDLHIPLRLELKPVMNGGLELLKYIYESKNIIIPDHIIGITANEDSFEHADSIFSDKLLGLIKYNEATDEWSDKISSYIARIIEKKKSREMYSSREYDYDIGIVCALHKMELENVLRLLENWETKKGIDGQIYYLNNLELDDRVIKIVAAAAPQMGMVATSVLASNMISQFTPKYMAMTGIAAGFKGKVELGDVLVADPSWDYGLGKMMDNEGQETFLPDIQQIRLNSEIRSSFYQISEDRLTLEKIRNSRGSSAPKTSLNIHIGPVASGSYVVANETIAQSIQEQSRKLIGLDMEIFGFMYTCENSIKPRPIPVAIKSVCDFADNQKNDDYQDYAAYTSASILFEFIKNYMPSLDYAASV